MRPILRAFLLLIGVSLSGCGYRVERALSSSAPASVSIPFVEGKCGDLFTNELVKAFSQSGAFVYLQRGGRLQLSARIINDHKTHIGYRYDRQSVSGDLEKNLVSTEGRREVVVEVSLTDTYTGKVVIDQATVSSDAEYDYVDVNSLHNLSFINGGERESVMNFSLGQLDSVEGAEDNSLTPLYRSLSKKIVSGILNVMDKIE